MGLSGAPISTPVLLYGIITLLLYRIITLLLYCIITLLYVYCECGTFASEEAETLTYAAKLWADADES